MLSIFDSFSMTSAAVDASKPIMVGFVGWRGMVGSVLLQRMVEEGDYDDPSFEPVFFSTSQQGQPGPKEGGSVPLSDATSVSELGKMAIIVSCQGGEYTQEIHPKLRGWGWNGYWVDAASALRTQDNAVIVLDPINRAALDTGESPKTPVLCSGIFLTDSCLMQRSKAVLSVTSSVVIALSALC